MNVSPSEQYCRCAHTPGPSSGAALKSASPENGWEVLGGNRVERFPYTDVHTFLELVDGRHRADRGGSKGQRRERLDEIQLLVTSERRQLSAPAVGMLRDRETRGRVR